MGSQPSVHPRKDFRGLTWNPVQLSRARHDVFSVGRHAAPSLNVRIAVRIAHLPARTDQALAIAQDHRVQVHQVPQSFPGPVRNAGNDAPAVGMTHQHHVRQLLPLEHVHDVGNVRIETDVGMQQVGPLAASGKRGRIHPMPLPFQDSAHESPAPAAVAGAVNQDERYCVQGA